MLGQEYLGKRKQPEGGYFYSETSINQKYQDKDDCIRTSRDNSFSNQSSTAENKLLLSCKRMQIINPCQNNPQHIELIEDDYFPSKTESISINQKNLNLHQNDQEVKQIKKRCGIKDIHSKTSLSYKSLQAIIPQDDFPSYEISDSIKKHEQYQQLYEQQQDYPIKDNNHSIIEFMNNYKLLDKDYNAILNQMNFEIFHQKEDIIFKQDQLIRIANKFSLFLKGQYKELKNYDFMEQQIKNSSNDSKQSKKLKKKQSIIKRLDNSFDLISYTKQQQQQQTQSTLHGKTRNGQILIDNKQTDQRRVFGSSIDKLEFDIFGLLQEQELKENESGKIIGQQKRKRGNNHNIKYDGLDSLKEGQIQYEKMNDAQNRRDIEEEDEGSNNNNNKMMNCSGEQEQYDSIDISNNNNQEYCTAKNLMKIQESTVYISQEINLSVDRSGQREHSRHEQYVIENEKQEYNVKYEYDNQDDYSKKEMLDINRNDYSIINSQQTKYLNLNNYKNTIKNSKNINNNELTYQIMQQSQSTQEHHHDHQVKVNQSKVAGYRTIIGDQQDNEKYKSLHTMIKELKQNELNQQKSKRTLFNLSKYVMQLALECLSVESLQDAAGVQNDLIQIGKIIERVKCQGQRKTHSQTYYYNSQFYNALFLTLNATSLEFVKNNKSLYKLHQAIFDSDDFSSSAYELIRINQLKARLSQIILVQFKFLQNLIQGQKKLYTVSEFNSFTNYMLTKLAYFDKVIKAIERLQKGDILTRF